MEIRRASSPTECLLSFVDEDVRGRGSCTHDGWRRRGAANEPDLATEFD